MSVRRAVRRAAGPIALALGLLLLALPAASAQSRPEGTKDPYTKGQAAALERAGYARLDGSAWGDDHDTRDIEQVLGKEPVAWIETAHFRLGCSLPDHTVLLAEKDVLRDALAALKKRVPGIKEKAKVLDRWMLAHLYALRLEALYAEVQELLGVTDADFVPSEPASPAPPAAEGEAATDVAHEPPPPAPYLGQRDKYCVLLLGTSTALSRYAARWGRGGEPASPQVLNFHRRGSLGFVTTNEFFKGNYEVDAALHAHVVWQVAQNLLRGYRGYNQESSYWLRIGFAHLLARRVDPRFCPLPRVRETPSETFAKPDWAPSVRALVGHEVFPTLDEMGTWTDDQERSFAEHRFLWSRLDHLARSDPDAFARFLRGCKEPIVPAAGGVPTADEIAARERAALLDAYGWTPAQCDAAWVAWVGKEYPRR